MARAALDVHPARGDSHSPLDRVLDVLAFAQALNEIGVPLHMPPHGLDVVNAAAKTGLLQVPSEVLHELQGGQMTNAVLALPWHREGLIALCVDEAVLPAGGGFEEMKRLNNSLNTIAERIQTIGVSVSMRRTMTPAK